MSHARYLVGDVFDRMTELEDGSVDLIVTSPPFLALRSYLPVDHPDKGKEIGAEPTPAAFIDTLLALSAEWRRLLAPHGSIAVELGDTYAGSGGGGGDYYEDGRRAGQPGFTGSVRPSRDQLREANAAHGRQKKQHADAWPLAKSKTLIPELYRVALAYGIHPLTGQASPAGSWRIRNVVTWCRPNPPVGALGEKWRPATSDIVVACVSPKRYWDDIATRRERAPLLDYWELPPGAYPGSHYAVYPPALIEPLIKAMAPSRVCQECGEPSRRIVEKDGPTGSAYTETKGARIPGTGYRGESAFPSASVSTVGFTDCGHNAWRPALVLDPFAGSGTTLMVATGHGHDAIGIDIDERNADLARERIGELFMTVEAA